MLTLPSNYLINRRGVNPDEYKYIFFQQRLGSTFQGFVTFQLEDGAGNFAKRDYELDLETWIHKIFSCEGWEFDPLNTSPFDWKNIKRLYWYSHFSGTGTGDFWIDNLFIWGLRFSSFQEDEASKSKYGAKPLKPIINEKLLSDDLCEIYAKEVLERRKNPQKVIEAEVFPANLNLKQGDRIRVVDDIVHGIDEYARILEVTHILGTSFRSELTLSTEIPSFALEFEKIHSKIERVEARV